MLIIINLSSGLVCLSVCTDSNFESSLFSSSNHRFTSCADDVARYRARVERALKLRVPWSSKDSVVCTFSRRIRLSENERNQKFPFPRSRCAPHHRENEEIENCNLTVDIVVGTWKSSSNGLDSP